jgi:biopolymer transport protein ExbD
VNIIPQPAQRRRHDFTLTMINIVFLLLLFFLTTGSLTNREEAQAEIPVTRNLPLERLPRPLLMIQRDGTLLLDGQPVTGDSSVEAAQRAIEATGRDDTILSLLAPPDMPAAPLLSLAERLRASGITIQIVTIRETPSAKGAP